MEREIDMPGLVIRSETLDAFAKARTAQANDALVEYLRRRFPNEFGEASGDLLLEIVRSARTRARRFGIEREDNVSNFLDLTVMFPNFPDAPWATTILNSASLHGPDKMTLLKNKLKRNGTEF